jgi:hypothetical protein
VPARRGLERPGPEGKRRQRIQLGPLVLFGGGREALHIVLACFAISQRIKDAGQTRKTQRPQAGEGDHSCRGGDGGGGVGQRSHGHVVEGRDGGGDGDAALALSLSGCGGLIGGGVFAATVLGPLARHLEV